MASSRESGALVPLAGSRSGGGGVESAPRDGEVDVARGGGTGRTWTVLAFMAILAGGPEAGAVAWVRSNYHSAPWSPPELQVPLIARFALWASERDRLRSTRRSGQ
jgi:hypothetical protein